MGRAKVARKSTFIDMTAMCDVTFLLLSFFILTAKFKPDELVPIQTPSSVATKPAPDDNVITMSLDKDGRAFIEFSEDLRDDFTKFIDVVNKQRNAGLSTGEINAIANQLVVAAPVANLKQQAAVGKKSDLSQFPGVPIKDTADNQMKMWLAAYNEVYLGDEGAPTFMLKGDNLAKFPEFKNILKAMTDNNIFKFSMVTNQRQAPEGTYLWRKNVGSENQAPATTN